MAKRQILVGATDQTVDVFIQDSSSTTGAGLTGLAYNTASLTCYYRKGATGTPTALSLATQTVGGAHSDGGFVAVDGTNCPGQYRLDLSDTIVATAGMVTVHLKGAANMVPCVLEIEVVDFSHTGQSAIDLKDFADAGYDPSTNKVQGVVLVDTLTTYTSNTPQTGDAYAIVNSGTHGNSALKTLIDAIDDFIDTEVAAIKAKTDNLPSDPADASDIAASFTSLNTKVDTIDDFLDTEIAAIKAKTDNLPSDPADASDISTAMSAISSALTTIAGYLDTEVAAILADTNELQTDWVNGGRLDMLIDAIKLVLDRVATMYELDGAVYRFTTNALEQAPAGGGGGGGTVGEGSIEWEITIQDTGGTPIGGVEVWITTDNDPSGNIVAGTLTTDNFGVVTFMLDAGTYYRWAQRAGYNFTHPQTFVVS